MKTVYEFTPGVKTTVELQGDDLITATTQDCTPFLEYAADMRAAGNVGTSEMRYAGTLPDVVIEQYCNRAGITFAEFMGDRTHVRRILMDHDFSGLRIWEGRL